MRLRIKSVQHALRGILFVFKQGVNFRIMVVAGIAALIASAIFPLEDWQRILIILLVASVLVLEMLNTAVELLSDALKPRMDPMVKEVKDLMAGAVLLLSITAAVVGIHIFWSYVWEVVEPVVEGFGII